jgi:hypothetical protein
MGAEGDMSDFLLGAAEMQRCLDDTSKLSRRVPLSSEAMLTRHQYASIP